MNPLYSVSNSWFFHCKGLKCSAWQLKLFPSRGKDGSNNSVLLGSCCLRLAQDELQREKCLHCNSPSIFPGTSDCYQIPLFCPSLPAPTPTMIMLLTSTGEAAGWNLSHYPFSQGLRGEAKSISMLINQGACFQELTGNCSGEAELPALPFWFCGHLLFAAEF